MNDMVHESVDDNEGSESKINDGDAFYSSALINMWEQYVKFLNIGLIGVAAFFGLIVSIIKGNVFFTK